MAPLVADLLGASWCDLDSLIVARSGKPVAEIFAAHGESHFRELERAAMAAALDAPPQVIASGGGWAAQPGNLAAVADRALLIYLSLSPEVAAARVAGNGDRPLLANEPPLQRLTELLVAREHWYRLAEIEIAAGGESPDAVAASVAVAARRYGGW